MSRQKPQPKGKVPAPEQRDDLDLDAETIKDLDPRENGGAVHGGVSGSKNGLGELSDVRLKEVIEPLAGSLMKLRLLRIG